MSKGLLVVTALQRVLAAFSTMFLFLTLHTPLSSTCTKLFSGEKLVKPLCYLHSPQRCVFANMFTISTLEGVNTVMMNQ